MKVKQNYVKALLAVYPILPKLAASLEKCSYATALSGFAYCGDTMDLMERMLSYNERKVRFINAKVAVNTAMSGLEQKHAEILSMRFFSRKSFLKIADETGVHIRTVFRRYVRALDEFTRLLEENGFEGDWLEECCTKEPVFVKALERVNAPGYVYTGRASEDAESTLPRTACKARAANVKVKCAACLKAAGRA